MATNGMDVPFTDGIDNQEREYYYRRIVRHFPELKDHPDVVYGDNRLAYLRLINEGLIAEVPDYDPESLQTYVDRSIDESNLKTEVDAVKAAGGLSAHSPVDGQTALLMKDQSTLTHAELDSSVKRKIPEILAENPAVKDAAVNAAAIAVQDAGVVTWIPGKNLFNYAQDTVDSYLDYVNGNGIAYEGYRLSDYIPVIAGQSYVVNYCRHWSLYDSAKNHLNGNIQDQGVHVFTPTVDGFYRFSYDVRTTAGITKEMVQVEKGTVPTSAEPFIKKVTGVQTPTDEEAVKGIAQETIEESPVIRYTPSKNLYDPEDPDVMPGYTLSGSVPAALANYTLTGYIPVTPGVVYSLSNPRNWSYYGKNKESISINGADSGMGPQVIESPVGAYYLRASYVTSTYGDSFQVEEGPAPTEFEPHTPKVDLTKYRIISAEEGVSPVFPLTVEKLGDALSIKSKHGDKTLSVNGHFKYNNNAIFNLTTTTLNGSAVHGVSDEPAPLRTQHGTVGANHGYAGLYTWHTGNHDKTLSDLGSVWTDGTREFVLLAVNGGKAIVGPEYSINGEGEDTKSTAGLTANLTHVSGAVNTAPFDVTKIGVSEQLWPIIQKLTQSVTVDGNKLEEGQTEGSLVEIRESYEIMQYAGIYDTAKANPGSSYLNHSVQGCARIETLYKYTAGGVCTVDVSMTEITPTRLAACGLVQAAVLSNSSVRYVPGVKTINGKNWTDGVDLTTYSENQKVSPSDFNVSGIPPTMTLDVDNATGVAFVLGIDPWKPGVTTASNRVAESLTNLWDLRSSRKSYPTVIETEGSGWGRYEGHAVRAYLTLEQANEIIKNSADSYGAWAALEAITTLVK